MGVSASPKVLFSMRQNAFDVNPLASAVTRMVESILFPDMLAMNPLPESVQRALIISPQGKVVPSGAPQLRNSLSISLSAQFSDTGSSKHETQMSKIAPFVTLIFSNEQFLTTEPHRGLSQTARLSSELVAKNRQFVIERLSPRPSRKYNGPE